MAERYTVNGLARTPQAEIIHFCGNSWLPTRDGRRLASPDWRRRGGLFERRLVVQRYPARVILIVIILIS